MTAPAIEPQGPAAHPWVAEARHTVGFSLVGAFLRGWAELRDFVVRAEELGFDAYWANDHPSRSMDCWTQLAALAAVTTRIRLISLVSCVYYRSPVLLARQAADVDLVSGGRLVLGLGIGDDVAEFRQFGLDFPAPAERLDALAETIDVTRGLWDSPLTRHRLAGAQVRPGPVQQPRVPILIGGGGERKTLRLVAQYAQACNLFAGPDLTRKLDVLRGHCEAVGRDYDEITKTVMMPLDLGTDGEHVDATLERLRDLAALGVSHVHGRVANVEAITPLELFGERVIPVAAGF